MKIAIIGASGLVGRKMIESLTFFNNIELICYCSSNSKNKVILGHKMIELSDQTIKKVDFALFSAGGNVSKEWAKKFIDLGAIVIDNSNAFRRNENVPLVIPEINIHSIKNHKLIANPNCSTIQVALVLHYLKPFGLKSVIASTYQSASGAGNTGIQDLENNTTNKFPYILKDNLIPQIDTPLENGFTLEEDKMMFELKKILELPNLHVVCSSIRVPIHYCHGVSVYVEFEQDIDIYKIKHILNNSKGIVFKDDLKNNIYPLPSIATNSDSIYVGRIRQDPQNSKAILFWCVADNLRKGASTNAIQILTSLINHKK